MKPLPKRCAIYTRKSSDEGLDQAFNSLDAQREAGVAYVKSQASEGWRLIDTVYDDGGFSGGSMERPALKQLLVDIAAGQVDVIVVYKIDRLTRSLADFARMVELFDTHAVSFVSVTQSFNTTSSMGRLTLNVLLSFAQFEREVTGERIRDKIAASKARGMWMGGTLPLGYDPPADKSRALVVNPAEAESVRSIFTTYLEVGSVHALQRALDRRGIRSKARTTRSGKLVGNAAFSRGALFHLLRNKTYLGKIVHREQVHDGLHEAIVDPALFDAVQVRLDGNARRHTAPDRHVAKAALVGRLFDCDGEPMVPTFSHGARGQVYRYYVSAPLTQGKRRTPGDRGIRRLPAVAFEAMVASTIARLAAVPQAQALAILMRAEVQAKALHLLLPSKRVHTIRANLEAKEQVEPDPHTPSAIRLILPVRATLRGGRTWIETSVPPATRRDPVLIKALRTAHALVEKDAAGMPVLYASPASPYLRRLVRLAFLAPDLQRMILAGRQPTTLTLERLMTADMAIDWGAQAQRIGAFEA